MPTEYVPIDNAAIGAGAVDAASQKQDLARQIIAADRGGEGGIVAQLSSNPFFTAVQLLQLYRRNMLLTYL